MIVSMIKKSQFYLIFSFLGLILSGTLLLKCPFVELPGGLSWIDALFTATSAVCVVGLNSIAFDQLNLPGQLIVLLLIQGGGLGMMTLTASIVLFLGRNISWGGKKVLASVSDDFPINNIEAMIRTIISYTFFIEFAGFILLIPGFIIGERTSVPDAIYYSLFHTVSAFCNAGFSVFPDNLIGVNAYVKMVLAALIVSGGLGFYVIYDIYKGNVGGRYHINTRIVLTTTFFLIVGGALMIKGLEYLAGNAMLSWVDAVFQSVTCRTAGFNSVNLENLHSSTLLVMTLLMLIGGSPNSTAGGMKTTTVALVAITIWSILHGRNKVVICRREIAQDYIIRSFAIMMTFLMIVICCSVLVCTLGKAQYPLKEIGFEVVSAVTTTGLSLGYSTAAGAGGKLALIICMFVGRIGPFSIFMFLMGREKTSRLTYPEEPVFLA